MKTLLRFLLIIGLHASPFFCMAQYWSENFEAYDNINTSSKYGYRWKNANTYTGAKAIESRSLITGNITPNTPGQFNTGYFLLENKKYTINLQHRSSASTVKPLLTVYLVDENNIDVAAVFNCTYSNQAIQFSEFSFSGYKGWHKLRFHFSSNETRESFQCSLDNINSTIPVNPETNSSVILADIQTSVILNSVSPSIQELEITFTNLGPDPCFIEPAGGTAILSNLRNVSFSNVKTKNLDFDSATGQINFITNSAPDSFGVNQKATLVFLLKQTTNIPVRANVKITSLNFQRDHRNSNDDILFYYDGANIPLNWKKIELTTINNRDVHIYWETLIEVNANRYEIQRSEDGDNFIAIGSVIANNNAAANSYHYNDYGLTAGKDYYYRIKLMNQNGATTYSSTQRVSLSKANFSDLKIYPSILRPGNTLSASMKQNGNFEITLLNSNMKAIMRKYQASNNNNITITLPGNLTPGIYYISFNNKSNSETITKPLILND